MEMSIKTTLDDCQYCTECCKWQDVFVEDEEINTIAKKTGTKIEDFSTQQYFKGLIKTIYYPVLIHKLNGDCVFLETNEKTYACLIYKFRPKFCAEYPSGDEQLGWCNEHKPIIESEKYFR